MDADCGRLGVGTVQRAAGEKIQELLKRSRRRLANMAETSMRAERRGRVVRGVAAVALLVCGACWAQSDEQLDLLGGLRHGNLVVWMVRAPSGRAPRVPGTPLYRSPTPGFSQSTTGSFGQSASSVGTNAGDYGVDSSSATISAPSSPTVARRDPSANTADGSGYKEQTSGSYGQTSSSYGTAASNHGQTASSLGQNASTAGQTASSYGQTAGSFGNSLSTIAQAGVKEKTAQSNEVDPLRDELRARLQSSFPQLTVTTREVPADELGDDLRSTKGTAAYPDVLVGALPQAWTRGLQSELGLAVLPLAGFYDDGVTSDRPFVPEFAILSGAPHPSAARAFAMWMGEVGESCEGCVADGLEKEKAAVAAVATDAVKRLLRGEALGDEGDPEMAAFPPTLGRLVLTASDNHVAGDGSTQVQVLQASANGKLAGVTLRVVASSDRVFGVAHPLVVLRKGDDGKWRVLHVSLNLPAVEAERERETLMEPCTETICSSDGAEGVTLAAPANGEVRQPMPDLWWDNGGGARLQVVEWQTVRDGSWSDARLFLVPDRGAKLRTQVTARFATVPTKYRWRVWSVGAGGVMKLSGWRTMVIEK